MLGIRDKFERTHGMKSSSSGHAIAKMTNTGNPLANFISASLLGFSMVVIMAAVMNIN